MQVGKRSCTWLNLRRARQRWRSRLFSRFIPDGLHFLHHLLYAGLCRVVGNSRFLSGKIDTDILYPRDLLQPLLNTHGAGGTSHAFQVQNGTCICLRFLNDRFRWLRDNQKCRFIAHRVYLLYHLLNAGLQRVKRDSRFLAGKVDVRILYPRHFLESFFDAHSTGGTSHAFNGKNRLALRRCRSLRIDSVPFRTHRFSSHNYYLYMFAVLTHTPW